MRKWLDRKWTEWRIRRGKRLWTRQMMRAIDQACEPNEIWIRRARRVDGLRAIRELESLSGRLFDPFDPVLCRMIAGLGCKVEYRRRTAHTDGRIAALDPSNVIELEPKRAARR